MEQLKSMKELLTAQVQAQLANIEKADAKELGAAVDMIKDISETMYYCSVVEAMEEAKEEEKRGGGNGGTVYYTERYLPMYMNDGRRYNEDRYMYRDGDNDSRRYQRDENSGNQNGSSNRTRYHEIPYYDFMEPVARDLREGRSPRTRRMYMEAKEQHQGKEVQMQELEKYMGELSQDITEMIGDATLEEKQMLHKKLAALTSKVEQLAH